MLLSLLTGFYVTCRDLVAALYCPALVYLYLSSQTMSADVKAFRDTMVKERDGAYSTVV
jgi:hypothetical protein